MTTTGQPSATDERVCFLRLTTHVNLVRPFGYLDNHLCPVRVKVPNITPAALAQPSSGRRHSHCCAAILRRLAGRDVVLFDAMVLLPAEHRA
jgi:hypothetical protein